MTRGGAMTNDLIVPDAMDAVICGYAAEGSTIEIHDVSAALQRVAPDAKSLSEPERVGAFAEILAFGLTPSHGPSPWGTYFGPMGSGETEDGRTVYFPDIEGIDERVIAHWKGRAGSVANPVLQARYSDLVWDIGAVIGTKDRDPEMARLAADAYGRCLTLDPAPDLHHRFDAVARALALASSVNDAMRVEAARTALMVLHREAVRTRKLWWRAFDELFDNRRSGVTEAERAELVQGLDELMKVFSDPADPGAFDPHATEAVGERLTRAFRKTQKPDDARRIHAAVARTFEHFAGLADPMLAATALQTAVNAFREAGLRDESARMRLLMEEKIAATRDTMAPVSIENEIKHDDMEAFLEEVVVESLGQTFVNIAAQFLCQRTRLEQLLRDVAEAAPLQALIPQVIMADDHVAAKIGSVTDDLQGRLLRQAVMSFAFDDVWLHRALEHATERHGINAYHVAGWANRLGLFDDMTFLLEGVDALLGGDRIKGLHVLVPQIEHGLRSIVDKLGKPVTKAHGTLPGVSVSLNMGDILNNKDICDALGPDLTLHVLALYADPRGRNLRNNLAHGLMKPEEMSLSFGNWVLHTLLVFGIWDKLAEHRR